VGYSNLYMPLLRKRSKSERQLGDNYSLLLARESTVWPEMTTGSWMLSIPKLRCFIEAK
jgi:hypothetical protein